jgi:hypothetical protein
MMTKEGLPVRDLKDRWLVGFKVANLVFEEKTGDIGLLQVYHQGLVVRPYGLDATAFCALQGSANDHAAPGYSCKCGFNVWDDEAYVWEFLEIAMQGRNDSGTMTYSAHNPVVFRVGLYGRVIEGVYLDKPDLWGYKGEKQRVDCMLFTSMCSGEDCHYPAQVTGVLPGDSTVPSRGYQYLRPLCYGHASERGLRLTPQQLSAATGVRVFWHYR